MHYLINKINYYRALWLAYRFWAFWDQTNHYQFTLKLVRELHLRRCELLGIDAEITNNAWRVMRDSKPKAYRL